MFNSKIKHIVNSDRHALFSTPVLIHNISNINFKHSLWKHIVFERDTSKYHRLKPLPPPNSKSIPAILWLIFHSQIYKKKKDGGLIIFFLLHNEWNSGREYKCHKLIYITILFACWSIIPYWPTELLVTVDELAVFGDRLGR